MKIAALLLVLGSAAFAEAPVAQAAIATFHGRDTWRFDVTISHGDTGWDHYADKWVIEDDTGHVLGERMLAHPHETEQPFTRSLSAVPIPQGVQRVFVRAHCNIDGWSTHVLEVHLK